MIWERNSRYSVRSAEGYIVTKARVYAETIFVAWPPGRAVPIYSGDSADDARAACVDHWKEATHADQLPE